MVYLAIGNDIQWAKFTALTGFEKLATDSRKTNAGRMKEKDSIYKEIGNLTCNYTTTEFADLCKRINLSVAPVNTVKEVAALKFISEEMIHAILPDGKDVGLFPPAASTEYLKEKNFTLSCAPRLGQNTDSVLNACGISKDEIAKMHADNTI